MFPKSTEDLEDDDTRNYRLFYCLRALLRMPDPIPQNIQLISTEHTLSCCPLSGLMHGACNAVHMAVQRYCLIVTI